MVRRFCARFRALAVRIVLSLVHIEPITTTIGQTKFLVHPRTGRLLPIAAGGSPDDGEGDGDDADGDDAGDGDDGDAAGDGDDADDDDEPDDKADKGERDWKKLSRRHERAAKKAQQERDEAQRKLKDQEDAKKSEQQKAVEAAEKKAREETTAKYEKERRQDRLEAKAATIAAKGVKVKTGEGKDEKTVTVRFADPDDALVYLERDIKNGDLDEDDLFDDNGKPDRDKIEEALQDLYDRKPHLFEEGGGKGGGRRAPKVEGGADGGKGGGDVKDEEDASVDDHFKTVRRHKPAA